jgi:hypothetical protein
MNDGVIIVSSLVLIVPIIVGFGTIIYISQRCRRAKRVIEVREKKLRD